MAEEQWLILVQIGYRSDRQPAPFATGTYQVGVGVTDPQGTLRAVAATYQPHGPSCSEGGQRTATGGTLTYTTVTDTLVEGSYDLELDGDRVQGPSPRRCACCAPRARPRGPAWSRSDARLGRRPGIQAGGRRSLQVNPPMRAGAWCRHVDT